MRFPYLVIVTTVVSEDRPGVDSFINLQQAHADLLLVSHCQRPKTPIPAAVLRANTRMHDKRAYSSQPKDSFVQQILATRQDEIGLDLSQKLLALLDVRPRTLQNPR